MELTLLANQSELLRVENQNLRQLLNLQKEVAYTTLNLPNIKLLTPLDYPDLIWIMNQSHIILTDSGGIQEEAPSLGKPVLVLREVTERMEGIKAGTATLIGSNKNKIVAKTCELLDNMAFYKKISTACNPYGDGNTSKLILEILSE